jgi:uncharacterized protein YbcI
MDSLPKQARVGELVQAADGEARDDGTRRAAISNAMVGLKKEFYGKGPTAAKTYFNDDWVFVVLEGGLTRNEETLLANGDHDLVRRVRLRFQEAMRDTIVDAISEIAGRDVLTYYSQILFEPHRTVEMFLLAPEAGGDDRRSA